MPSDYQKSKLETILPGVWDREMFDGPQRELQVLYFSTDGNWKQQKKVEGLLETSSDSSSAQKEQENGYYVALTATQRLT